MFVQIQYHGIFNMFTIYRVLTQNSINNFILFYHHHRNCTIPKLFSKNY